MQSLDYYDQHSGDEDVEDRAGKRRHTSNGVACAIPDQRDPIIEKPPVLVTLKSTEPETFGQMVTINVAEYLDENGNVIHEKLPLHRAKEWIDPEEEYTDSREYMLRKGVPARCLPKKVFPEGWENWPIVSGQYGDDKPFNVKNGFEVTMIVNGEEFKNSTPMTE